MGTLQTEYDFRLPKGFVDDEGNLHRRGTMRLATARDEIEPLRDNRVVDADDPYLTLIVLSRVITSLGTLRSVSVRNIEDLFAADLAFLQDFYGIINFGTDAELQALQATVPDDEPRPVNGEAGTGTDHASSEGEPRKRTVVEEVPAASRP